VISPAAASAISPRLRRTIITACAMMAMIMQSLDTTIANVALPYMQGSLSASLDQVNWVLTSYIVAAAIMTAPVGWLAHRFGRKRLFTLCIAGFTLASVLCGASQTLEQLILFRLFQGMCGAALVPLSQSLVIDLYPFNERPRAQSIFGMGVMLGPILGPTLGAFLTDTYSWHWVFFVNLPFGLLSLAGLLIFLDDAPPERTLRFDWFGFTALAFGIGGLQLALDRGEQVGWLDSTEIVIELTIAAIGLYYFMAHSLTTPEPFIRFEIFKDRNFRAGCLFQGVMGVLLFGTMALASPFLQQVAGFPIMTAGWLLATRGCGTFFAMMTVRRLLLHLETRVTMVFGLILAATTIYLTSRFTNETPPFTIAMVGMIQGFAFGTVFVSLNNLAFLTLPNSLRTYGSSFLTLVRNTTSSIGISVVVSQLSQNTSTSYARLAEHITPFNDALKMPDVARVIDMTTETSLALLSSILHLQAQVMAYSQDFELIMMLAMIAIPIALLIVGPTKAIMRSDTDPTRQAPREPRPATQDES
jgi:DHA2 family multidrug resistance protein